MSLILHNFPLYFDTYIMAKQKKGLLAFKMTGEWSSPLSNKTALSFLAYGYPITYLHYVCQQQRFVVNIWAGIVGNHLLGPVNLPPCLNGEQLPLPLYKEDVPLTTGRGMWFQHDDTPL
ncbi:hypothetical protein ANN_22533 [Periplaneta americana]|uniref:Per a allergen n=1 Tax=Periplaneta americana TaxID=6978 RepID=A0ABQ8S9C8_PERAM|nr:hypothetical protein ANN_22533 [Periplaneta americana]